MKVGRVKIISASLPEDLIDVLGDISVSDGITRSHLLTQAAEAFIRYRYPHMWKILEVHRNA